MKENSRFINQSPRLIPLPNSIPPLCSDAEPRMKKSIQIGAAIILEQDGSPLFVYKFIGKPVGLCIRDDGEFCTGNWYYPHPPSYERLGLLFDYGYSNIEVPPYNWSLMREADPYILDLVMRFVTEAQSCPFIPVNCISRDPLDKRHFRVDNFEGIFENFSS